MAKGLCRVSGRRINDRDIYISDSEKSSDPLNEKIVKSESKRIASDILCFLCFNEVFSFMYSEDQNMFYAKSH